MANAEIRIDTRIGTDKIPGDLGKVSKEVSRLQSIFAKQTAEIQATEKALADMNVQLKAITENDVELKSLSKMNSDLEALNDKWQKNSFKVEEYADKIQKARDKLAALQATSGIDPLAIDSAQNSLSKLIYEFNKLLDEQDKIDASANKLREDMKAIKLDPALSEEYKRLAAAIAEMEAKLAGQTNAANETAQALKRALGVPTEPLRKGVDRASKSVKKLGRETRTVGSHARHAASEFERMMSRIKSMILSVAIFSMLRTGLVAIRNQLGSMLKTNAQFNASLNLIKVNLLTAFQPIYEAILPALLALMNALAKATAYLATFISMLFGKTYEQSKASASAIYDQAKALDATGKAADKASKKLLAFDEINQITGDTASDNASSGGGIDFGAGQDLSWLTGVGDIFQGLLDKLQPTIEAMKNLWAAMEPFREFVWQGLRDFYNNLLVPIGEWVLGEGGLPRFFGILQKLFENVDWGAINESLADLWTALSQFAIFTFDKLLDFLDLFLIPLSTWVLSDMFPKFVDLLTNLIQNIDWNKLNTSLNAFFEELLRASEFVFDALFDFYNLFLVPLSTWVLSEAFPRFVDAVTNMLAKVDWNNLNGALERMWQALLPFTENVGEGLLWFWEEVITPLIGWALDNLIPTALDLIAEAIELLNSIIEGAKPALLWFWDTFLVPIRDFLWNQTINFIELLTKAFKGLSDWAKENPEIIEIIATIILDFLAALWVYNSTKKIIDFIKNLITAFIEFGGIKGILTALGTAINSPALAITALTTAILFWIQNWDKIKNSFDGMENWQKAVAIILGVAAAVAVLITALTAGVAAAGILAGLVALGLGAGILAAGSANTSSNTSPSSSVSSTSGGTRAINSTLSSLKIGDYGLPKLAKGGVLKKGQKGFLEGDGAEAVVPLEQNTGWIRAIASEMSEQLNTFVVSPEVMRSIVESEQRRNVVRNTASDNYDMAQAIGEAVAMNMQTQTQTGTIHVVFEVGGQQFGEASVKYGDQERNRLGDRMSNRMEYV